MSMKWKKKRKKPQKTTKKFMSMKWKMFAYKTLANFTSTKWTMYHSYIKQHISFNLKLAFTDWFFIILIKLSKIWYLNLDKALLFPRTKVICLKNWKLWRAPTTIKFIIFWWNFSHVSYLTMSTKGCSRFFYVV